MSQYDLVVDRHYGADYFFHLACLRQQRNSHLIGDKVLFIDNYSSPYLTSKVLSFKSLKNKKDFHTTKSLRASFVSLYEASDSINISNLDQVNESFVCDAVESILNLDYGISFHGVNITDLLIDGFQRTHSLVSLGDSNDFVAALSSKPQFKNYCRHMLSLLIYLYDLYQQNLISSISSHHSCYAHFGLPIRFAINFGIPHRVIKNENIIFSLSNEGSSYSVHSLDRYFSPAPLYSIPSRDYLVANYGYKEKITITEPTYKGSFIATFANQLSYQSGGKPVFVYFMHSPADNNFPFSISFDSNPRTYLEHLVDICKYCSRYNVSLVVRAHPSIISPLYKHFRRQTLKILLKLSSLENISVDIPYIDEFNYDISANYIPLIYQSSTAAELAAFGFKPYVFGAPPLSADLFTKIQLCDLHSIKCLQSIDRCQISNAKDQLAIADFHRSRRIDSQLLGQIDNDLIGMSSNFKASYEYKELNGVTFLA